MRRRVSAILAGLLIVALMGFVLGTNPPASARLQDDDGTPVGTPADEEGTPVAEPEATGEATESPEPSGIVTIVMWYQQNESGEILQLRPIMYADLVASSGEPADDTEAGRVVFDEERNDGFPRIRVGEENYFDAFPIYDEDPASVQRWFYYNDDPAIRPATMVMQVIGIRGDYEDWFGTATFVSRGGDQGGIMVLAVSPPPEEE
jgi:hypothetical protein